MPTQKPNTLSEWQAMFKSIYGDVNSNLTLAEIWLHLTEEAGEVARDMRKEDFEALSHDLPDVFAWLCSFANCAGISLDDAVWSKYPGICPYCIKARDCVCISEAFQGFESTRLERYRRANPRPASFDQWTEMFKRIYGNVNQVLWRASIGFHLMEEIGEVAKFLRADDHEAYGIEVADVFAWLLAIPMKMKKELGGLDEITWDIYPGVCKRCRQMPCRCEGKARGPRS